jgi:hypothetical protein
MILPREVGAINRSDEVASKCAARFRSRCPRLATERIPRPPMMAPILKSKMPSQAGATLVRREIQTLLPKFPLLVWTQLQFGSIPHYELQVF